MPPSEKEGPLPSPGGGGHFHSNLSWRGEPGPGRAWPSAPSPTCPLTGPGACSTERRSLHRQGGGSRRQGKLADANYFDVQSGGHTEPLETSASAEVGASSSLSGRGPLLLWRRVPTAWGGGRRVGPRCLVPKALPRAPVAAARLLSWASAGTAYRVTGASVTTSSS